MVKYLEMKYVKWVFLKKKKKKKNYWKMNFIPDLIHFKATAKVSSYFINGQRIEFHQTLLALCLLLSA